MHETNVQYCTTAEELNEILSNVITDEEEDDEEVYKMAGVMAQCGGLECMLNRLSGIKDFKQGRHLLTVSQLLCVCLTKARRLSSLFSSLARTVKLLSSK